MLRRTVEIADRGDEIGLEDIAIASVVLIDLFNEEEAEVPKRQLPGPKLKVRQVGARLLREPEVEDVERVAWERRRLRMGR
jgi:hypothetical protein